jgi:hypothetical protein
MFGQNKEKPDFKSNMKQDNWNDKIHWVLHSMEDLGEWAIKPHKF